MENIAVLEPVNNLARIVTSPGFQYAPAKKIMCDHWDILPPVRNPNRCEINSPAFFDFTGFRFGRFTVIGIHREKHRKACMWVCRCSCGHYETRSAKAMRNQKNVDDCCGYCQHVRRLKRYNAEKYRRIRLPSAVDSYAAGLD